MSLMYTIETTGKLCEFPGNSSSDVDSLLGQEDARTEALRRYSYGVVLPAICCCGIVGNVLNLVVLTRKNMRGTAYIYMRANYIDKCSLSSPHLNACLKKQSNKMIPVLGNGDVNLGIPILSSFKLPRILLTPNEDFTLDLRNCSGLGAEKMKILKFRWSTQYKTIGFVANVYNPLWICDFTAKGDLRNIHFDVSGSINITYVNLIIEYTADYDIIKINKVDHYEAKNDGLLYHLDKIEYVLRHPDDDNNIQVNELNRILNEDYNNFEKEFIPTSKVISSAIITQLANKVFHTIPANDLFDL